jgi:dipeptidyl aminopeptidase/acylaminoacyl peptidase
LPHAATIAAVLGASAGLVLRTWTVADPGLRPDRTVATHLTDYGGSEEFPAISPDGRAFVFVSNHGGTPDIWLRQIAGGEPVRLTSDAALESDLVYAPDGESVYFTRSDAEGIGIWQTGVLGGRPRRMVAGARAPAVQPDLSQRGDERLGGAPVHDVPHPDRARGRVGPGRDGGAIDMTVSAEWRATKSFSCGGIAPGAVPG